ncbi:MAG: NADH-quinone oxidoreductase subunit N [Vicinamibacteraceae bacterium]|nr:NADH-quinone oxidoreductase subunit N [Vicinamibacteraceae bacterium]
MPAGLTPADFGALAPELWLTGGMLLLVVLDLLVPRARQGVLAWVAVAVLAVSAAAAWQQIGFGYTAFKGLIAVDGFAVFFKFVFLGSAAASILMAKRYLEVERVRPGEFYVLVLCATLGMNFMASGLEFITLFIGLETMAVAFYVLAGFLKPDRRSNEAAIKYFVLGTFSLGILLYGMSVLYGLTGTTKLREMAVVLASQPGGLAAILGVILVGAGMAFKLAAVPFHMWAPDVYEGAPTPITAFLSVGSKAASFAMFMRLLIEGMPSLAPAWQDLLYAVSVMTMVVGNVAALTQGNIKRMLAYSSIGHAGYLLMGLVAGTPRGYTAMMIYLAIYAFMQLGAFAVVAMLRREEVIGDELKDLSGLFHARPAAALAMLVFMLSLGGIPPTAGFMGKLWLFGAAIDAGYVWLAVLAVLMSAVSLYYYLRVVVFMFMREAVEPGAPTWTPALALVIGVGVVGTLLIGMYPAPLFEFVERSALSLGGVSLPALTLR